MEKENPALTRYRFRLTKKSPAMDVETLRRQVDDGGPLVDGLNSSILRELRHTAASRLLFNARFHQRRVYRVSMDQFCALPAKHQSRGQNGPYRSSSVSESITLYHCRGMGWQDRWTVSNPLPGSEPSHPT
jgi:hypothetical protein